MLHSQGLPATDAYAAAGLTRTDRPHTSATGTTPSLHIGWCSTRRDTLQEGCWEVFLWYRPGLCQCRFRSGYKGLYRAINCLIFFGYCRPKLRQYRSKPAAQLLRIRPGLKC